MAIRIVLGREAEVSQLDHDLTVIVLLTKQVLWLEISMHDFETVHVVQRQQDLLYDIRCIALGEASLFTDHFQQVAAGYKFHDDVVVAIIFHQLKDARDVGMERGLKDLKLILIELLVHFIFPEGRLANDFDGAWNLRLPVLAELNSSKRATPNLPRHHVMFLKPSDFLEGNFGLEREEVLGLLLSLQHAQCSLLPHDFSYLILSPGKFLRCCELICWSFIFDHYVCCFLYH